MNSLIRDLRLTIRTLRRSPGFAVVAMLTIGVGIGANTAIFSVLQAVLLRPLPYENPGSLMIVWGELRNRNMANWPHSPPDYWDYREQSDLFEDFAGVFTFSLPLTGEGEPVQVDVAGVTDNFFSFLGVSPAMGRDFTAEDVVPPDPDVAADPANPQPPTMVLLSHGFWQRRFGSDPGVIGRSVELGGQPSTIIGVLPAGFRLWMPAQASMARNVDVWAAARIDYQNANRNNVFLRVLGRLKPGVSLEQARAELAAIAARIREVDQISETAGFALDAIPLHEDLTAQVRPVILALMGAVAFVLLIACANVSNLLLVRASSRERELAIRAALGGGRGRLIREMLLESVALAGGGAILGLALAWGGIQALLALQPEGLPRIETVGIDGQVLGFTVLAALLAALVFGILPAVQASRPELAESLKERGRAVSSVQQRLRSIVVTAEVGLSLVLLIGTGLMIRSFVELHRVDPGYNPEGILTFDVSIPGVRYPESADRAAFQELLRERLEAIPGVQSVSAALPIPLDDQALAGRYGPEEALEDETLYGQADYRVVLPGYFETLGTRLVEGRTFTEADNADSLAYVVVDTKLAQALWPGQSAIGRRLLIRVVTPDAQPVEIIGVVQHQRHPSIASEGRETVFFLDRYVGSFGVLTWTVRTGLNPLSLVSQVRMAVAGLDPLIPLDDVRLMQDYAAESIASIRFALVLIAIFGGMALLLASVGLYGVLSYVVRRRTAEIGVRMAFGADATGILRMVIRQGLTLAAVGVGMGILAALALTQVMESVLIGVAPTDPVTYAGISLFFLAVAALASFVPAWRAARLEPVAALRQE